MGSAQVDSPSLPARGWCHPDIAISAEDNEAAVRRPLGEGKVETLSLLASKQLAGGASRNRNDQQDQLFRRRIDGAACQGTSVPGDAQRVAASRFSEGSL